MKAWKLKFCLKVLRKIFDADRAEIWGTSTVWRVEGDGIFVFCAGGDVCGKRGFGKFYGLLLCSFFF